MRHTLGVPRCVLFDVDGTLINSMPNLRRVWDCWADGYGLDRDHVWECATRTLPLETFAEVAPDQDPAGCLTVLHELEDEDARNGVYHAFAGTAELLGELPVGSWAAVTGNYAHRVKVRFDRLGLPLPCVLIDAGSVRRGKPDPEGYLTAARQLGAEPADCLVIEDSPTGVKAGLNAGMTVWAVNGPTPSVGGHRHYSSLRAAAPDISSWVIGARRAP